MQVAQTLKSVIGRPFAHRIIMLKRKIPISQAEVTKELQVNFWKRGGVILKRSIKEVWTFVTGQKLFTRNSSSQNLD